MSESYHPDDRINLEGLKNRLFKIYAFIMQLLAARKLIILAGLLAGIAAGIFYYKKQPALYQASMLVTFNKLTKRTYAEILERLNIPLRTGATVQLAKELHITPGQAGIILYIDSRNLEGASLLADTSSKRNQPFTITVGLSADTAIAAIQNALITYLNNLPYLKRIAEADRKNNGNKISFAENELEKLDSLKTAFNHFLSSSPTATIYNNAINPAEIYVQSNNLVNQKAQAFRELYVENDAVSVVDGLKVTEQSNTSLLKIFCVTVFAGLLAGFMLAVFVETKKK